LLVFLSKQWLFKNYQTWRKAENIENTRNIKAIKPKIIPLHQGGEGARG
jgi:hypothetical protein